MTRNQAMYRAILNGNHGRDVDFIANLLMTGFTGKVGTCLRNLLAMLADGREIRRANFIDQIRIDGERVAISALAKRR